MGLGKALPSQGERRAVGRLFSAQGTESEKALKGEPARLPDDEARGSRVCCRCSRGSGRGAPPSQMLPHCFVPASDPHNRF